MKLTASMYKYSFVAIVMIILGIILWSLSIFSSIVVFIVGLIVYSKIEKLATAMTDVEEYGQVIGVIVGIMVIYILIKFAGALSILLWILLGIYLILTLIYNDWFGV